MLEIACFLGVEQNGEVRPRASAFYVTVPFDYNRKIGRGYLVTARHNVKKAGASQLYASINKGAIGSDRKAAWLPIETERWFTDDLENADVALADWRPAPEYQNSYLGVLTDNFIEGPPDGQPPFQIAIGMETATIGLFSYHAGVDRHTPVMRSGNIAAVPTDAIAGGMGKARGYLIEARSVGGLSGSPVLIGEDVYQGLKRQPLLGLIHGHFDWKDEASAQVPTTIHTGMAVVTPSSAILRVLKSPDCVATRQGHSCIF